MNTFQCIKSYLLLTFIREYIYIFRYSTNAIVLRTLDGFGRMDRWEEIPW